MTPPESYFEYDELLRAAEHVVASKKERGQDYVTREELDQIMEGLSEERPMHESIAMRRGMHFIRATDEQFEEIRVEVRRRLKLVKGEAHVVKNDNHEWLDGVGNPIHQTDFSGYKFLERFKQWLAHHDDVKEKKAWPAEAIKSLEDDSLKVLRRLDDPTLNHSWRRRGMVVGHVQSGKTANFTALANRAFDTGFDIVIVLTGIMEDLRQQTQERLDQELVGIDSRQFGTDVHARIGVGAPPIPGRTSPRWTIESITTNQPKNGDFGKNVATQWGQVLTYGAERKFLIVAKKNTHILKRINTWLASHKTGDKNSQLNKSLLLIDDECDQASVNTGATGKPTDLTAINKGIRKILHQFKRTAYVGYTATPFANIFIESDSTIHATYEELIDDDLFPRDFIVMLDPSSEYVGPGSFFGLSGSDAVDRQPGFPVVRFADADATTVFPRAHKKELEVNLLPASLRNAILYYLIAGAIKLKRGIRSDHTMLVHVSRFVNVQFRTKERVEEFLEEVRLELLNRHPGEVEDGYWNQLASIFEEEIGKHQWTQTMAAADGDFLPESLDDIVAEVREFARRVLPVAVNGDKNSDLLEYNRGEENWYIAIGGDRLSRGLTLKGLTVSYFIRDSRLYDALMQMGRWFGYRQGYLELCRLYTTSGVYANYRHVALAIEELRQEFRQMELEDKTPKDFGLKVRMSPVSGFIITSRNKLRQAKRYRVSLSGQNLQILAFDPDPKVHGANHGEVMKFIAKMRELGYRETAGSERDLRPSRQCLVFHGVSSDDVMSFLATQKVSNGNQIHNTPTIISKYIRNKNSINELTSWTVVVPLGGDGRPIPGIDGKMSHRHANPSGDGNAVLNRVKVITSPGYEAADLSDDEFRAALDSTRRASSGGKSSGEPQYPSPTNIRRHRPPTNGLLALYAIDSATSTFGPKPELDNSEDADTGWHGLDALQCPVWGYSVSLPGTKDESNGVEYLANETYVKQMEAELEAALEAECSAGGDEEYMEAE